MNNELKNLIAVLSARIDKLELDSHKQALRIDKIEDNLDYRKHVVYFGHSPTSKLS